MGGTKPPVWATTYKFAIKETIPTYEEIYTTDFYLEGYFRWVRLEGASKNKIKEGDILLVKRDSTSIHSKPTTVEVLEVKTQSNNFIAGGVDELSGLYMKIKPSGFDMPYNPDAYKEYTGFAGIRGGTPYVTLTIPPSTITNNIPEGSVFTFTFNCNFSNEDEYNDYTDKQFIASSNYPNFKAFYDVQLSTVVFQGTNTGVDFGGVFEAVSPSANEFVIRGTSNGKDTIVNPKSAFLDVKVTLRTTAGFMIFEKTGLEQSTEIFYETPEVFNIVNGEHEYAINVLEKTFNCFSHGNGSESSQIRDAFN